MDYNLILHMDSDEAQLMRLVLRNAANYLNALEKEKFQLVIVANGPAVRQFIHDNGENEETGKALAARGAQFRLCANALRDNGLAPGQLWPFCAVVPAGLVEIVELQRAGYAYIKP